MHHDFIIGDIHGCAHELETLLSELKAKPGDHFYFLGDLINRGPDSHGVFEIARSLPNLRCLIGNHELRLLRYKTQADPKILKTYDWDTLHQLTEEDWEFMGTQMEGPIYLEDRKTLLVHGGFLPNKPWREQGLDITTHIQVIGKDGKPYKRGECDQGTPWQDLWKGPPHVIYGHIPRRNIARIPWSLGIDTGCVMGGKLSCCVLPEREIVQVKAAKNYANKPLPF